MAILNRPIIKYFRANSVEVMANDEVILEWDVENARKVRLDGIVVESKDTYNLFLDDTRTFELTATNWTGKESEAITVRLLKPVISKFEVNSTTIKEGQPVEIYSQIKNTFLWRIAADYGASSGYKQEILAEGKIDNALPFSNTVSAIVKGPCKLTLHARNGFESTVSDIIRLFQRQVAIELGTTATVVSPGSSVHITWKAQHANRIILNPGNIDVTDLSHYDFLIESDRDIHLELKAFGDFGQQVSDTKTLYLARINRISVSNNGDPSNAIFYLNWSATGLQYLKLLPGNIPVNENEINYEIPAGSIETEYKLAGLTYNAEEVSESIILHPCSIRQFYLEKGKVIMGTMATLCWEVSNCKRIQLKFSDSPGLIEIPVLESKYHFQVFKGRDKVRLFVWGDINVAEQEIPIPAFESPEVKSLRVPVLNFQLGINWISSPLVSPAQKTNQLFFLINTTTVRNKNFYWRLWHYLSLPSLWMLHKTKKSSGNKSKNRMKIIDPSVISGSLSALPEKLFTELDKNLEKTINDEQ